MKVLIDSNIFIEAYNNKASQSATKLKALLNNNQVAVFITPLIRYEVLRGVKWDSPLDYEKFAKILDSLTNLNIDKNIAIRAADLFRLERYQKAQQSQQPKKIDKHNFDIMHFATAKQHALILISNDEDMQAWEELNNELDKAKHAQNL